MKALKPNILEEQVVWRRGPPLANLIRHQLHGADTHGWGPRFGRRQVCLLDSVAKWHLGFDSQQGKAYVGPLACRFGIQHYDCVLWPHLVPSTVDKCNHYAGMTM